jgi:uncharacterized protein YbjT (DUF2867 family)
MSTNVAKPGKVAIIGASGTYGTGILARAEEIGVEAVVIKRSPHKFKEVKPTTTVVEAQLDEEEKLREALTGCDGVISALGDDRTKRPKAHNLPHVWNAMKAAGVTKYIGKRWTTWSASDVRWVSSGGLSWDTPTAGSLPSGTPPGTQSTSLA